MSQLEGGPASQLGRDASAQLMLLPATAAPRPAPMPAPMPAAAPSLPQSPGAVNGARAAAAAPSALLARLAAVDLERTTPLQALHILAELQSLR
jgi:hypothetical protein